MTSGSPFPESHRELKAGATTKAWWPPEPSGPQLTLDLRVLTVPLWQEVPRQALPYVSGIRTADLCFPFKVLRDRNLDLGKHP